MRHTVSGNDGEQSAEFGLGADRLLGGLGWVPGHAEGGEIGEDLRPTLTHSIGVFARFPGGDGNDAARPGVGPAVVTLEAEEGAEGGEQALIGPAGELVAALGVGLTGGNAAVRIASSFGSGSAAYCTTFNSCLARYDGFGVISVGHWS
ncbi:MAG: hypothetical protein QOJ59_5506 [Thermomicrobiales bacterium]|jgi:hypothetical protein|nr:hypothetical protein [Thermomicrobiales bacterium]